MGMRVTDHTNYQNYQNYQNMYEQNSRAASAEAQAAKKDENIADTKTEGSKAENAPFSPSDAYSKRGEERNNLLERMRQRTDSAKKAFSVSKNSTLYSSTSDLMSIANTESPEILRGIYVRLSFKLWSVRAAGATGTDSNTIKNSTRSIEKVMGKVKGKIRSLKKEEEMEKKIEAARKAKQRRLQQEIRRELAIKRKIRKNKERKDVADSYLESDGQYSVKSYKDTLPENVQVKMEMQQSGGAGIADVSMTAADLMMNIDSSVVSLSAEAAVSAVATDAGGAIVDVAL